MSPEPSTNIRELFERAAALEPGARRVLLDSFVTTDPEAAAEVRSLLEHHDRTDAILDQTPVDLGALLSPGPGAAPDEGLSLPATLGSYTLERPLGSGGMGVVYRARQASPSRRVAVKLIRPEILSAAVLRRFENEAEVLGLLEHPGIARVYEAGRAPLNGHPRAFMAMELVEGEPLTRHAERTGLPERERIELLAQVCDAVQFAHRRGVIHRDLKPANILVAGDGRPRVVDFGVARVLAPDRAATLTTGTGQIVGTLAYMSPEQARGDAAQIDSRSDIYSLGAILFELLCGRPPIDVSTLSVHGALAAIQTVQPRIPGGARPAIARDLEAILLKALEKDPARRYQHASELAQDLRRYLAGESVTARVPSPLTQFVRFCRKHTQAVAAAAIVVITLVSAVAYITTAYAREHAALSGERLALTREHDALSREQARAEEARGLAAAAETARDEALVNLKRYEAVSGFMRTLLGGVKAEVARGKDTALLRSLLDTSEKTLPELDALPAAAGDARLLLAEVFRDLGEYTRAEGHLKEALRLYALKFGGDDRSSASAMHDLGALYRGSMRRLQEAEPLIRRACEIFERLGGPDDTDLAHAQNSLYLLYLDMGDYARAEPLLRTLRLKAEQRDPDSADALRAGHNHAGALAMIGRPHEAAELARLTYERRLRLLGADHPDTVNTMLFYGRMLTNLSRTDEAIPLIREGLRLRTSAFGPSHQATVSARGFLADALRQAGRIDEALAEATAAAETAIAATGLGPTHLDTLQARLLVLDLRILKDPAPARLEEAERILAGFREKAPPGSFWIDVGQVRRGMGLACAGRNDEAEATLTRAYTDLAAKIGARNGIARRAADSLAWFYDRTGRPDEAATWRGRAATPAE